MADISLYAISVCIQAVDNMIVELEESLDSGTDGNSADLQDFILSYEKVALELKKAYVKEWEPTSNYPSYEKLMEGRKDRWGG